MTRYPQRPAFFAHKFCRILQKACVAQDIGPAATLLLCFIAQTEDAARYSGPVKFWNAQLMETMGFRSPKQLNEARKKAIESGWLVYLDRGTRSVGEYFVTIPARFRDVQDTPMVDEDDESILSAGGTNGGTNPGTNQGTNGGTNQGVNPGQIGFESGTESGKPSYPIPNPIPNPKESLSHTTAAPPANDGPKINESHSPALIEAIRNWHQYWSETHGEGQWDSPTRVEGMVIQALSKGWDERKIIESIKCSINWRAKSWRDPANDYDQAEAARRQPKPKRDRESMERY